MDRDCINVISQGKEVLRNMNIQIRDVDALSKRASTQPYLTVGDIEEITFSLNLPAFLPNKALFQRIPGLINIENKRSFNVFYQAENGDWTQLWRLRKKDNKWLQAIKVSGKDRKDLMPPDIDEGFLELDEEMNWN